MQWKQSSVSLENLNALCKGTIAEQLGILFSSLTPTSLSATMPVDDRTRQPFGLLHGGASAVLAETVGSVASTLCIDPEQQICVGVEINCNHVRGKKEGVVTATAEALHLGVSMHVWDIKIRDEQNKLICVSRLTVTVLQKKQKG
ncbi:MAG: hotdog fold thioesterase [Bacteroidetes bacterium]|nr:hotdog fold thioesterase [Bacteroidota bacterium]MBS1740549.1 hotdog fold thioesterase [Bacteroidota bacterium]MBS1776202.1 hotdog fold thioesterase [Bacteroidota bacterium]